jgi:predicted nucleotidyltransferase
MERQDPRTAALEVVSDRFGDAAVTFLSGSVTRGEATETSDLDLVVVYERVANAYRESFAAYAP